MLGWSPRDLFAWRLSLAGLMDSPLGQRWISAVERASEQPLQVGGQYRTSKAFTDDQIEAHVYQVALERGEKLVWQLSRLDTSGSRLYASLERHKSDKQGWSTIEKLNADGVTKSWVAPQPGTYRIVLQPELFARVEYSLAIATGGSLPFPVEAASQRNIGSSFGASRDGGAREHHGVDIFAKRGTPSERSLMAVFKRTQVALAATTCGCRAACWASAVRATTMHTSTHSRLNPAMSLKKARYSDTWATPVTPEPRRPIFTSGFTQAARLIRHRF